MRFSNSRKWCGTCASLLLPVLAVLVLASVPPGQYPKDYFRSPLGIPIMLAGSFAEMRSNHFHSGLDIKTNGQPGYRIYAAAEGWISRISVSPRGFGNALYVTHPNGYVTVYAHLDRFSEAMSAYVKERQYERQSFAVELFPSRSQFRVKEGEIIAFSGNSGSSSGPHLHFEVRNERTGWPENPLLFGFDVTDTRAPRIIRTKLYAVDESSRIRVHDSKTGGWRTVSGNESLVLDMKRVDGVYLFSRVDSIEAAGRIGFGIQTYDTHDGSANRLGTFQINLFANEMSLFSSKMDRFSFDQTRYINAHVDYEEYIKRRRWIQRSHILPGNALSVYDSPSDGLLQVEPGDRYNIRYELIDTSENETRFEFTVSGMEMEGFSAPARDPDSSAVIEYNKQFEYSAPGFRVSIPAHTLYENVPLQYETVKKAPRGAYSSIHRFQNRFTPVHTRFTLAIDGSRIPPHLKEKALIASVGRDKQLRAIGGSFIDGYVEAQVRGFGEFVIAVDSIAPRIRPLNISPGKNLVRQSSIRLQIRDNMSGIASYRGEIDGEWTLFLYDAKYALLKHIFDGSLERGKHILRMEVTDLKGNEAVYEVSFTR